MTNFIMVAENQAPTALEIADDDRFPSLSNLLEDLLSPQLEMAADPLNENQMYGLYVERLAFDVPMELQTLRNEHNKMEMGATFPTQWIETSVQPVLHRLRLTLELDDADHDSGNQALES